MNESSHHSCEVGLHSVGHGSGGGISTIGSIRLHLDQVPNWNQKVALVLFSLSAAELGAS